MTIEPGEEITPLVIQAVSAEKMKTLAALLGDPNNIHFDADAVRSLGLGDKTINQGPSNLAYVMNMLIAWSGSIQNVRKLTVRFMGNVVAGDRLIAGGRVTSIETGDRGLEAHCDVWLDVVDGGRALGGTAVVGLASDDVAAEA